MKKLTNLGNEIFVVEKLLEPQLCAHILQITQQFELQPAGIELEKLDKQIRSNSSLYLDNNVSLLKSINDLLLSKISLIQKLLYEYYGVAFPHVETCSILRYQPGEFYKRHIDNLLLPSRLEEAAKGVPTRDVSLVGYLNEDCDPFCQDKGRSSCQNLKIKPKMGNVVVFPAFWTHPHQSLPVIQGVKYSFVTWLFH